MMGFTPFNPSYKLPGRSNRPRARTVVGRLAAAAFVAAYAISAYADVYTGPTTRRGKPDFDPAACEQHRDGKYYIALGRNVLGVPPTGTVITADLYPGTGFDRLPASDPAASIGCFGNPKQLHSYGFLYYLAAAVFSRYGIPPEKRPGPELLQLFRTLHGKAIPSPNDREWPGETSRRHFAELECEHAAVREELTSDLTACRIKPKPEAHIERVEDWGASYIARPEIYTTPLEKPFVVNCGPGLYTSRVGQCDVAYTIAPGLGVAYRFQPFLGPRAIAIDHIIEFDRDLRQQIESTRVPDYQWPDEQAVP